MKVNAEAPRKASWVKVVVIGRNPKRTLARIVFLALSSFLIFKFVLLPIRVQGGSMLPTYRENGVNFIHRLAYVWSQPKRGDVIGIRLAGPSIMYMKRIVGLPGETVSFHHGRLLINGEPVDEPYVKFDCNWEIPPEQVGVKQYYVVGDNRSMPEHDHTKGKADRGRIVGKVLL